MSNHVLIILSSELRIFLNIRNRRLKRSYRETLLVNRELCLMSSDIADGDFLIFVRSTLISHCPRAPDCCSTPLRLQMIALGQPHMDRFLRLKQVKYLCLVLKIGTCRITKGIS